MASHILDVGSLIELNFRMRTSQQVVDQFRFWTLGDSLLAVVRGTGEVP
jgi:hypothetical protein